MFNKAAITGIDGKTFVNVIKKITSPSFTCFDVLTKSLTLA